MSTLARTQAAKDAARDGHSGGRALDAPTRSAMESRFGVDLSGVRVHDDAQAAASAAALGAKAYTVGRDITFARARFAPDTPDGQRLLAHELAHVVQQSRGGRPPRADAPDAALEQGAAQAATQVTSGIGPVSVAGASSPGIACEADDGIKPARDPVVGALTPAEHAKLRAFGPHDYTESLQALREIATKTGGLTREGSPQQYKDIRSASGELWSFFDAISDPEVTAMKVVPHPDTGRAPDCYCVRKGAGTRIEVVNLTQTSADLRPDLRSTPAGDVRRIETNRIVVDGKEIDEVALPTNKSLQYGKVRSALSDKLTSKASSSGSGVTSTQFDAQNVHTQAGGKPMAVGGTLVLNVHGSSKLELEALERVVGTLQPKFEAAKVTRVLIHGTDATSGQPRVFEFEVGPGSAKSGLNNGLVRPSHFQTNPRIGPQVPAVGDAVAKTPGAAPIAKPAAPAHPAEPAPASATQGATVGAMDPGTRSPVPPHLEGNEEREAVGGRPAASNRAAPAKKPPPSPTVAPEPIPPVQQKRAPVAPDPGPWSVPEGGTVATQPQSAKNIAPPRRVFGQVKTPAPPPIAVDAGQNVHAPHGALATTLVLDGMGLFVTYANNKSAEEGQQAANKESAEIARLQQQNPEEGWLLVVEFTETNPDSPALNIANQGMISRPFLGVEKVSAQTRWQAEAKYARMGKLVPGTNVLRPQFTWFPPLRKAKDPEFAEVGQAAVATKLAKMQTGLQSRLTTFKSEIDGFRYGFWAGVYAPFKLDPKLLYDAKSHIDSAAIAIQQGRHEAAYKSLLSALEMFRTFDATLDAWRRGQPEP